MANYGRSFKNFSPIFFFQLDNGLLVHQRGGIVDNILFMATITVNAIGLAMGLQFFYHAAYKL